MGFCPISRSTEGLCHERAREVNRGPEALARATITLATVASDIPGVSGRAMPDVLIAGRADPQTAV